jgi:hypothetical protein
VERGKKEGGVFADLVLDGCDNGGKEAILRRFVLPIHRHVDGVAETGGVC